MEPVTSDGGDAGPVQVWETFTDTFVLRDGSPRDMSANLEVVLDIRHDYDLDTEDITELLLFRAALVPKEWVDSFDDTIKKTATEIAECIDSVVDEKAKVDGGLRKKKVSKAKWKPAGGKKPAEKPSKLSWKQKQKRRRERLAAEKAARA
jgi:hypothetical protein